MYVLSPGQPVAMLTCPLDSFPGCFHKHLKLSMTRNEYCFLPVVFINLSIRMCFLILFLLQLPKIHLKLVKTKRHVLVHVITRLSRGCSWLQGLQELKWYPYIWISLCLGYLSFSLSVLFLCNLHSLPSL